MADRAHLSRPLVINDAEVIGDGFWMIWFLYNGEPWDIGRFYRPDGTWTGFYVDVLEPVHWESDDPATIDVIVDLFLDIWISADGDVRVLDEDEFDDARAAGHISALQSRHARDVLERLTKAIADDSFPRREVRDFAPPFDLSRSP